MTLMIVAVGQRRLITSPLCLTWPERVDFSSVLSLKLGYFAGYIGFCIFVCVAMCDDALSVLSALCKASFPSFTLFMIKHDVIMNIALINNNRIHSFLD